MKKKIIFLLCAIMIVSAALTGCGGGGEEALAEATAEKPITLKIAGQFPTDNPASVAVESLKKYVEEKSEGRLILEHYPANQLGDANLVFEGIMDGSVDMGLLYNSSQYDPMIEINSLPYLVTNTEEIKKVYSEGSNYFNIYSDIFSKLNVKVLGIHTDGLIGVHTMEEPKDHADFSKDKQVLIRTPAVDVYSMTAKDMGFQTVTISFSDLYTSMQTGVCKGSIGQTAIGTYTAFRDVAKYYIPYRAFVECLDYMINEDTWNALPSDLQEILKEGINIEVAKQFANVDASEAEYSAKLEEAGITILPVTDEERQEMAEYIRTNTWPKLYDKLGKDVMDKIMEDLQ